MAKAGVYGVAVAVFLVIGLALWDHFPAASAKDKDIVPDLDANVPVQIIENDELMKLLFDTNYVYIRNGLAEEPQGKKWRLPYIGAAAIAEVTNLLFSREDEEYMLTDEWVAAVKAGRAAAIELCDSLLEMDYEKSLKKYTALVETCNACHEEFELKEPTLVEEFL